MNEDIVIRWSRGCEGYELTEVSFPATVTDQQQSEIEDLAVETADQLARIVGETASAA